MIASQPQSSTPGASIPNMSASSSETVIPNGDRIRVVSAQLQTGEQQTVFNANRQEFANGPIADVRNRSHDSQTAVRQSPRYSGTIAKLTPTVAISYFPANPAPGSMVNLTATILAVGTGPTPTGSVRFLDGNTLLNMSKLNNGTVTVKEKLPYIATHSLSAIYYGDAYYTSASSIGKRE
jgi:Bacterial Ig-like domain (group 3)